MNGTKILKVLKEEKSGEIVADKFSGFVNSFIIDEKGFLDALLEEEADLQNKFTKVCFAWIKKMAYFKKLNWYDERNRYSVETCYEINKICGERIAELVDGYNGEKHEYDIDDERAYEPVTFEIEFAEKMSRTHRTLEQSFTGLVFKWLIELKDSKADKEYKEVAEEICERLPYKFERTPFI